MAKNQRFLATLGWLALMWAVSGGCHDVAEHVGESCESDRECREPYVCALGACRAACDVDRDCDGGACLVIDALTRVCTLPEETGCEEATGPDCPNGFECGIDGECRNPCDAERPCPDDRRCVEGTCFDSSGDSMGAGGSDDGPATGGSPSSGGGGTSSGGATTGGTAGKATHAGGEGGAIEDGGMGGGTTTLGGAAGEGGSGGAEPACTQAGEPIRAGGSLLDWAQAVAVGPDGAIIVGGQFIGTSSFGDTSLVSAGAEDGFLARYRADRSLDWARRAGGPYLDGIYSVAALPDGSVYAAGAFRGTATFGAVSLTTSAQSSGFLAKYDAEGTVVWAKAVGGTTLGGTNAVAAGPDGSARLLGYFQGEWAFDDVEDIASPQADAFLARFAPDGTLTWVTQTAGPGGSQPIGERSLAVSADGASFITGEFQKPISIGSTQLTVTHGSEAFLAKYDDHGDAVWARQSNAQGVDGFAAGWSVATSDDGSVYVGGQFGGTVTLAPSQLSAGGESGFLAKYRVDGSVDWATGGAGRSLILSVAADSDGSAYVTGGFLGAASFEDVVFEGPFDDFTMFVAKMDPSGKPLWGQQAAGSSWGRGVAVQRGCSAQVVGNFNGIWSFGSTTLSSRGQEDAFLVSVDATSPSRAIAVEPMDDARHGHAATLLPNQQVLVNGGFGPTTWLSTAELYDPSTQTWQPAAELHQRRTTHTSSLLQDGRVLVAGGLAPEGAQPSGALRSAEVYDPDDDVWKLTGALREPRGQHTATVLLDGKVLVAGGVSATGVNDLATAELYDPEKGSWSDAGSLDIPRRETTATRLLDGRVLVAGGFDNAGVAYLDSCELYDPARNSWSKAAPLRRPRRHHAAALLPNGKVIVVAGDNASGDLATAELYDPLTDEWEATGSLTAPRSEPTATLLLDGSVLLLGGASNLGPTFLNTVERYEPGNGVWSVEAPLTHAHYSHTATLLGEGHVLIAGGFDGDYFISNVDLFVPGNVSSAR